MGQGYVGNDQSKLGRHYFCRSKTILEWSDFKMPPESSKDLHVYPELTFGVFTKKVNVWTGTITVESYGGIRRDLSWVKPEYKSQRIAKL